MRKGSLLLVALLILLFLNTHKVSAQTFGPICDTPAPGVTTTPGVTCAPTAIPTTPPANPTNPPPVSGSTEVTLILLGISGVFVIGSIVSYTKAFSPPKLQ